MSEQKQSDIKPLAQLREQLATAYKEEAETPRRSRFRWRVALPVAAIAATGCFLALALIGSENRVLTVDEAVAQVADGVGSMPASDGGLLHARAVESFLIPGRLGKRRFDVNVEIGQESWTSLQRQGWTRTTLKQVSFPTEQDKAEAAAAIKQIDENPRNWDGTTPPDFESSDLVDPVRRALGEGATSEKEITCRIGPTGNTFFAGADLGTIGELESIPTDSAELLAAMRKHVEREGVVIPDPFDLHWNAVTWSLRTGARQLTPAERRSIIGVLALLPGVQSGALAKDPMGRETIRFTRRSGDLENTVNFDPETSVPTYSDTRLAVDSPKNFKGLPKGTTVQSYELAEYGEVESAPESLAASRTSRTPPLLYWGSCPSK